MLAYYLKGPWFYPAAFAALVAVNWERIREKFVPAVIPLTAAIFYILVIGVTFGLYAKDNSALPVFVAVFASLAMLALFLIINKGTDLSGESVRVLREQKTSLFIYKAVSALLLGVGAWYLLKYNLTFLSALVYAVCFFQLLFLLPYEKTLAQPLIVEQEIKTAEQPPPAFDINTLFSLVMVMIIMYRAFVMFTHNLSFEGLIFRLILAVMFSGVIFSFGKDVFWESSAPDGRDLNLFDFLFMACLFGVSFYIRTKLLQYPGSGGDDVCMLQAVGRDCANMKAIPVFDADSTVLIPTLLFWMIKHFMVFTGGKLTLITARLLCAFVGSLEVVFMYLLTVELFKKRVAVITGIMLSVLFIHILYSHQTVGVIEVTMATTAAFYFFMRGIRKGGAVNWIASGIALGFGLYFYNAVKFAPIIMVFFVLLSVLPAKERKKEFSRLFPGLLVTGITAFLFFYPVLEYAVGHPANYLERIAYTSMFKNGATPLQFVQTMVYQIEFTIQVLFYDNFDYTGLFCIPGRSIFNGVITFWFFIGLAGVIFLWKRRSNLLLLSWIAIGVLPALFSSYYNGGVIRALLVIPAVVIITGLGLELMLGGIEKALGRSAKLATPLIAAVVLLFVAYTNLYDFFNVYLNNPDVKIRWCTNFVNMGETVSKFKKTNYFDSLYYWQQKCQYYEYIQNSVGVYSNKLDISQLGFDSIYNNDGNNAAITAEALNEKSILIYREYFPHAQFKTYYNLEYWFFTNPTKAYTDTFDWKYPSKEANEYNVLERHLVPYDIDSGAKPYIDFIVCYIPYEDIKNLYGLNATYYKKGALSGKGITDGYIRMPEAGCDRVELEGLIFVRVSGKYAFNADPAGALEVYVDGIKRDNSGVELIRGLNRIKMVISSIKDKDPVLSIKLPNSPAFSAIAYKDVIKSGRIFGLACKSTCEGQTFMSRYYSLTHRGYWWYNAAEPCNFINRQWKGFLSVDSSGYYKVIFKSSYEAGVVVDGVKVYETDGKKEKAGEILLSAGRHRIQVEEKNHQIYYGNPIELLIQKRGAKEPSEVTYNQLSYE